MLHCYNDSLFVVSSNTEEILGQALNLKQQQSPHPANDCEVAETKSHKKFVQLSRCWAFKGNKRRTYTPIK